MNDINSKNQNSWHRVAKVYAGKEIAEDDPVMREAVRNHFCERLHGNRVVEIGCGPGTDAAKLSERGLKVTATDYAREFVNITKHRHPHLEVRLMDMTSPDLPVNEFDGIYGFGSFIHLPRSLADQTLKDLSKLLVPGGLICLQLIKSSMKIREYTIESWAGDPCSSMLFTCYDEAEIQDLLAGANFTCIECVPLPKSPVYENMPRLLERGIGGYLAFAYRHDGSSA